MVVRASSAWRKEIMLKNWFTGTGPVEHEAVMLLIVPAGRCAVRAPGRCLSAKLYFFLRVAARASAMACLKPAASRTPGTLNVPIMKAGVP